MPNKVRIAVQTFWLNCKMLITHASYLIDVFLGKLILWIGSEAPAHVTKMAESAASRMSARLPAELGLGDTASVSTIRQGAESAEFISALGTSRDKLVNLLGEVDS